MINPYNYQKPFVLAILDGFGYSKDTVGNAIAAAHKPVFERLLHYYPHAILPASGTSVGLLPHQQGNSEAGHLTIGSGRTIPSDLVRLENSIKDGSFFSNPSVVEPLKSFSKTNGTLHIIGLLSDGSVHSHEHHLYAFLKAAENASINRIIIHPILDGRDVPAQSASLYLKRLSDFIKDHPRITIGTLCGRFYAMDRDQNWNRTEAFYDVLTELQEINFDAWHDALHYYYHQRVTDEFIPPIQLKKDSVVKNGDGIIVFNTRPDRIRQLVSAFVKQSFDHFEHKQLSLQFFITPIDVDHGTLPTTYLFDRLEIRNTLKECLSNANKTMFVIAETEKYAHVTYFFNGLEEKEFPGEHRIMIPSVKTESYADYPCMSANAITDNVIASLHRNMADFYLINYANADMVGHSGNFQATIKAIECLDKQLEKFYQIIVEELDGTLLIVGDHGNAEEMIDEQGNPKKSHTINPVYCIVVNKEFKNNPIMLPLSGLHSVAPFILQTMNIRIPQEMVYKNS